MQVNAALQNVKDETAAYNRAVGAVVIQNPY
jgi:hypothetical protein